MVANTTSWFLLLRCAPLLIAALVVVGGCSSSPQPADRSVDVPGEFMHEADREFVRAPFEDQARAGTIRARTLYDYHFETEGNGLTRLGFRTVETVARTGSGKISVRRGGVSKDLYEARLESVRTALLREGVPAVRIQITDSVAGGAGVTSVRAIQIRSEISTNELRIPTGEMLQNGGESE